MKLIMENWKQYIRESNTNCKENISCKCVLKNQANISISQIQKFLKDHNYNLEESFSAGRPDGLCGPETRAAIMKFQLDRGIFCDACVGTDTMGEIEKIKTHGKATQSNIDLKPTPAIAVKINTKSISSTKFAAVGDSITVGIGAGNRSYIDILNGSKFAIGGKASFSLMSMATKAIRSNPEYLIVFMGVNNPMAGNRRGGCYKGWEDKLISDLKVVYKGAHQNSIKVIGITIPYPKRLWTRKYNTCKSSGSKYCCPNPEMRKPNRLWSNMKKVNLWITGNADIVININMLYEEENGMPRSIAPDGIHPNSQTQNWIAKQILRMIGK